MSSKLGREISNHFILSIGMEETFSNNNKKEPSMHSFLRNYWIMHTTNAREEASKERKWGAGHRD